MSFKIQVQTDSTGKWYDNAVRFETEAEAGDYAADLMDRWFAVREYRTTGSAEAVNYSYAGRNLQPTTESFSLT